jgi:putative ABC transport system permease protein
MIRDALLLALLAIRRNALRSSLTILGIVIGVAAVIVMVTLGSGATQQVTQEIAGLGSNVLMVMPGQRMGPGQGGASHSTSPTRRPSRARSRWSPRSSRSRHAA